MIAILLIVILLFLITYLIGNFFLSATGNSNGLHLTDTIFVGTVLVNTFLTIYSLFFPTDLVPVCILGILSLLLIFYNFKLKKPGPGIEKGTVVLLIPFALLVCLFAADGPQNADSISYHIPAIKWIEMYPVIPGLGNMHGRLAFNPNVFNLMAGFSFSDIAGQSLFAVNSFFSIALFYYLLHLYRHRSEFTPGASMFFTISGMLSVQFMVYRLSTPHPDLAAGLLTLYLFMRFAEVSIRSQTYSEQNKSSFLLILTLLAVYIVTIKLSSVMIVLLIFVMAWKYRHTISVRFLGVVFFTCLVILIPWIARNYYLSGYLVYPVNELDIFNPDWKIPGYAVKIEKIIVYSWAKWSTGNGLDQVANMKFQDWLPAWYSNISAFWKFFLLLCLISPFSIILSYLKNHSVVWSSDIIRLWVISFIGVVFWFFTAPDPRFGYPFIIVSTLSFLLIMGFGIFGMKSSIPGKLAALTGALFLVVGYCTPLKAVFQTRNNVPFMLLMPLSPDHYVFKGLEVEKNAADRYSPQFVRIDAAFHPKVYETGRMSYFSPPFIEDGELLVHSTVLFRGQTVEDGFKVAIP